MQEHSISQIEQNNYIKNIVTQINEDTIVVDSIVSLDGTKENCYIESNEYDKSMFYSLYTNIGQEVMFYNVEQGDGQTKTMIAPPHLGFSIVDLRAKNIQELATVDVKSKHQAYENKTLWDLRHKFYEHQKQDVVIMNDDNESSAEDEVFMSSNMSRYKKAMLSLASEKQPHGYMAEQLVYYPKPLELIQLEDEIKFAFQDTHCGQLLKKEKLNYRTNLIETVTNDVVDYEEVEVHAKISVAGFIKHIKDVIIRIKTAPVNKDKILAEKRKNFENISSQFNCDTDTKVGKATMIFYIAKQGIQRTSERAKEEVRILKPEGLDTSDKPRLKKLQEKMLENNR